MTAGSRQTHWDDVYGRKVDDTVSWFQEHPQPSLDLIAAVAATPDAAIIDIGGGASRLVDALLGRGHRSVTVLDLSGRALAIARGRLGRLAAQVGWIVADVTDWEPPAVYDVWHDRAAFHFLTADRDREAYVRCLTRALAPGGHAVIATFAVDGPERCSGLPVVRYDADGLARVLGPAFALVDTRPHRHTTPSGAIQSFRFSVFRRLP